MKKLENLTYDDLDKISELIDDEELFQSLSKKEIFIKLQASTGLLFKLAKSAGISLDKILKTLLAIEAEILRQIPKDAVIN